MKMNICLLHEQFCNERLLIRNFTEATIKWYQGTFGVLMKKFPEMEFVDEVTTTHLQRLLYDGRLERKWTAETFVNYYKGLKVFLDWCVKRGHLVENPILPIELPKLEKRLPKRISKQDAMKLLNYSFNRKYRYRFEAYRNQAIIAMFIYTGMRAKELLGLQVAHVDLVNSVIHVHLGKGNKDRVIPLAISLKSYLVRYLAERERLKRRREAFFASVGGEMSHLLIMGLKGL